MKRQRLRPLHITGTVNHARTMKRQRLRPILGGTVNHARTMKAKITSTPYLVQPCERNGEDYDYINLARGLDY